MAQNLALLQPQAYRLLAAGGALTLGARRAEDWPLENRVSTTVRLQRSGTFRELLPCLLTEARRFPGAANEPFRRALHSWARALWEHRTDGGSGFPGFDELEQTQGVVMPTVAEAAWDRWDAKVRAEGREEGVKQGLRQGIEQGRSAERARLRRQAALRFGARTGDRLSDLLDGLAAGEALDQVGDWIIECGSGDDLLSRVSALRAKAGNGQ